MCLSVEFSLLCIICPVSNPLLQRHFFLFSLSLSHNFPRDKVPISPHCLQLDRKMWGCSDRRGRKRKPQMLSTLRESPGSLSCVTQRNTALPDKLARLWRSVCRQPARYSPAVALLTRHEINPHRFTDKHLKWFRYPKG